MSELGCPDEWDYIAIDEIAEKVGSGATPSGGSDVYAEEGFLFIRSQNVYHQDLRLEDVAYIDAKTHGEMARSVVYPNDVLLNITGASIGRCCVVPGFVPEANVNQHVCAIRLKSENKVSSRYLSLLFSSFLGQDQIQRLNAGGNREGLNYQQVRAISFPWPGLAEQKAIATILDTLDDAIQSTEAILTKQEKIKQGLLQDLLTRGVDENGQLRSHWGDSPDLYKPGILGVMPIEWEFRTFQSITHKIIDGAHHTPTYTSQGIPFLRVTDVQCNEIDLEEVKRISVEEHQELIKRCKPERGDILYSKNGTVGIPKIVDWDWEFSVFVSLALIKPNHEMIDNNFLALLLDSWVIREQINRRSKQGTVINLHLEEIREFDIPIPSKSEQIAICRYFREYQNSLQIVESELQKLKRVKQGLMQDLLTGRRRVTPELIDQINQMTAEAA